MKKNLVNIMLAASIVLNLSFAAGYISAHLKAENVSSRKQVIREIAAKLRLTGEQQRIFKRLRARAVAIRKEYMHDMDVMSSELLDLLEKDSAEEKAFEKVLHAMTIKREHYQIEFIKSIRDFIDCLNREQRDTFFRIIRENKSLRILLTG